MVDTGPSNFFFIITSKKITLKAYKKNVLLKFTKIQTLLLNLVPFSIEYVFNNFPKFCCRLCVLGCDRATGCDQVSSAGGQPAAAEVPRHGALRR
jgi:hypothetical protein